MNIQEVLAQHGGNKSAAAKELGIPRSTLRCRMASINSEIIAPSGYRVTSARLAADAYSAKGGWVSGRDAKVITYHKKYGEVHRMTINPDMDRALQ